MTPYYEDDAVTLYAGDCLDVLATLPDNSVDAVVTDPPYGLEFMGREWDAPWQASVGIGGHNATFSPGAPAVPGKRGEIKSLPSYTGTTNPTCRNCGGTRNGNDRMSRRRCSCDRPDFPNVTLPRMIAFGAWCEDWARECLRVLKPGGHLLAFGGTRTYHRLTCGIEDAGFEIRDEIAWLYGSGFPKSLDVSKAIDKAAGAQREVVGDKLDRPGYLHGHNGGEAFGHGIASTTPETRLAAATITAPATDAARTWQGWGTALKPAHEPIVVARKPLTGTVAGNVLAHGTGALNIDGCRVPGSVPGGGNGEGRSGGIMGAIVPGAREVSTGHDNGRWPSNVLLDSEAADELDRQSGTSASDSGGASRFFPTFRYEAKAPTHERPRVKADGANGGVAGTPARTGRECNVCGSRTVPPGGKPWPSCGHEDWSTFTTENVGDGHVAHPTVKPLDLMRWLVRLVTPPGGTVLEPFAGSGTTAEACVIEGFRCIAVEREPDYLPLIVARLSKPIQPDIFGASA